MTAERGTAEAPQAGLAVEMHAGTPGRWARIVATKGV